MVYKERGTVVAEQYDPARPTDAYLTFAVAGNVTQEGYEESASVWTLQGSGKEHFMFPGDYLVTFPDGKSMVMSGAMFEGLFEPVGD